MKTFNLLKPIALIVLVVLLISISSCSEDEPFVAQDTTFTFLGTDYSVSQGLIFDYGAVNYVDFEDPTHYNYDFVVYDGVYNEGDETIEGSFFVFVELLSPGTNAFRPGSFSFVLPENNSEVEDVFYFNSAGIAIDGNGNNSVFETAADENEDLFYLATGGVVNVVENGTGNYQLTFNLNLVRADFEIGEIDENSETTLSFTVSSDFEIIETSFSGRQENTGLFLKK